MSLKVFTIVQSILAYCIIIWFSHITVGSKGMLRAGASTRAPTGVKYRGPKTSIKENCTLATPGCTTDMISCECKTKEINLVCIEINNKGKPSYNEQINAERYHPRQFARIQ
ncbi:uncharacterized protein LOC117100210 isoform X2 [Anneissia japonica]|uniref:uncharacterized protein LOC117100210 isoform X2 n=1 Tax=Anneissia japonica TaxID=1529436 RepID=UPI0014259D8A|nr:uncharacterized protein LOC117100210 isoform X2 [Anneissia japonica]